ncbi:MAG: hypothetical protein GY751_18455 [Bacteroidetes bacterium]|nr:hypothetical protein [Bacteroidota bacterium]
MKKYSVLFLAIVFMAGCDPDKDDLLALHTISSISPDSGTFSTIVAITGSGFSDVPGDNTVTFNGVPATVNSSTNSQLIVVVPEAAGTGTVNVTVSGEEVAGPVFNFEFLFTVSTLAGSPGVSDHVDGNGANARFIGPFGLALDDAGNIIVGDNSAIRKVTPNGSVSTIAGSGTIGDVDGVGASASFNGLYHVAVHSYGTYYGSSQNNAKIKKVTPGGVASTWIGSAGAGYVDGNASVAKIKDPQGIAFDELGNLLIADYGNNVIRKITSAGVVSTVAGTQGEYDIVDGAGSTARFQKPLGLAFDTDGILYISDYNGSNIRKMTPAGVVTTFAGSPSGVEGYVEGGSSVALFNKLLNICFGHTGDLVVCDDHNHKIRIVDESGFTTLLSGGASGHQDGSATIAQFDRPWGVVYDSERSCYYIGDYNNNVIRKILVQ